jgi:hypothetical protein
VLQRIPVLNEAAVCCLVNPSALDPEVRTLGDHLAVSRDLLIALADPMRQGLVQILARAGSTSVPSPSTTSTSCAAPGWSGCASKVARCATG